VGDGIQAVPLDTLARMLAAEARAG
jgi:hypothetical protein